MSSSKLAYLQKYLSAGDADAAKSDKKRSKKKKKKPSSGLANVRVVDADHDWTQDAPTRDDIEHKWEVDAAEDEGPVMLADGEEVQDLPVYVNAEDFLSELRAKNDQQNDGDQSPPRSPRQQKDDDASPPRRHRKEEDDDASPPRRAKSQRTSDNDASPPRRRTQDDDASPPRRSKAQSSRRQHESSDENDASPPRRRPQQKTADASVPRRPVSDKNEQSNGISNRRHDSDDALPSRRHTRDVEDDSPPRRSTRSPEIKSPIKRKIVASSTRSKDESPPRRTREQIPRRSERASADRQRRTDSLGRDVPAKELHSPSPDATRSSRRAERSRSRRSRSRVNREGSRRGRSRSPSYSRSRGDRRKSHRSPSRSRSPDRRRRRRERSCSDDRYGQSSRYRRSRSQSASPDRKPQRRSVDRSPLRDGATKREDRTSSCRERASSLQKGSPKQPEKLEAIKPKAPEYEEKPRAGLFTPKEFAEELKRKQQVKDHLHGADEKDMGANAETVYRDKRGRKLDMLNEMVRQQEILDGKRKREEREEYEWGTGNVQKQERQSQQQLMEKMKQTPFARHEDDQELETLRKQRVRAFDPMNSKVFQEDTLFSDKKSKKHKKKHKKSLPKYSGPPAPPNRFGITPGYRWDGVVRGTGWEEKLLQKQNAQTALSEDAYKYAVADM